MQLPTMMELCLVPWSGRCSAHEIEKRSVSSARGRCLALEGRFSAHASERKPASLLVKVVVKVVRYAIKLEPPRGSQNGTEGKTPGALGLRSQSVTTPQLLFTTAVLLKPLWVMVVSFRLEVQSTKAVF